MFDSTQPIPPDYQFPADAYWHLIRTLRLTLPPPPTDDPGDLLRRDHAAVAAIAGLAPGNIAEAKLAAQFVAASEQWNDCLRLAQEPERTPESREKCRAQALSMMREARGALRDLQRMQETRRKLEADNVLCTRLDRSEHCATVLMAEALQDTQAGANPPATVSPAAPGDENRCGTQPSDGDRERHEPAPQPRAAPAPRPGVGIVHAASSAWSAEPNPGPIAEPDPDPVAEAELCAAMYPERAALIRRLGRVPADASFGPPDDDLVQALISANTPALAALDGAGAQTRAA